MSSVFLVVFVTLPSPKTEHIASHTRISFYAIQLIWYWNGRMKFFYVHCLLFCLFFLLLFFFHVYFSFFVWLRMLSINDKPLDQRLATPKSTCLRLFFSQITYIRVIVIRLREISIFLVMYWFGNQQEQWAFILVLCMTYLKPKANMNANMCNRVCVRIYLYMHFRKSMVFTQKSTVVSN